MTPQNLRDRFLAILITPPLSKPAAWACLCLVVVVIALLDYASGVSLSLSIVYLVPVTFAAGWLGARSSIWLALGITAIRLAIDWLSVLPGQLPGHTVWNDLAGLPIFLVALSLLHSLVEHHRGLRAKVERQSRELLQSAAQRTRLELEILDISARERSAFGQELHDELGQHFFATALAAKALAEKLPEEERAKEARAIVSWIEEGISKTRKLARGLMLSRIPPERFIQELEELAIASSRGSVTCRLVHRGGPIQADPKHCAQLFRITQEAVANALRHSQARTVEIELVCDDTGTTLSITDDGGGLPDNREGLPGMGLRIMEHRATIIGGSLSLGSGPQRGTRVSCHLPSQEVQVA